MGTAGWNEPSLNPYWWMEPVIDQRRWWTEPSNGKMADRTMADRTIAGGYGGGRNHQVDMMVDGTIYGYDSGGRNPCLNHTGGWN